MKNTLTQLRPCPFCGAGETLIEYNRNWYGKRTGVTLKHFCTGSTRPTIQFNGLFRSHAVQQWCNRPSHKVALMPGDLVRVECEQPYLAALISIDTDNNAFFQVAENQNGAGSHTGGPIGVLTLVSAGKYPEYCRHLELSLPDAAGHHHCFRCGGTVDQYRELVEPTDTQAFLDYFTNTANPQPMENS